MNLASRDSGRAKCVAYPMTRSARSTIAGITIRPNEKLYAALSKFVQLSEKAASAALDERSQLKHRGTIHEEGSNMSRWYEDSGNAVMVQRLRDSLANGGRILVFLGAGLSFGSARFQSRATFDYDKYRPDFDHPGLKLCPSDDGLPLPSWPWLISRMHQEVSNHVSSEERESLNTFFIEEGPLDCSQLFRQIVGEANYREFLLSQFDMNRHSMVCTTPSHRALVELNLPLIFTTNYDELIEASYREAGEQLRVTINEQQFLARRAEKPAHHLVKLHGSIDQPDTIVLTRSDYAKSRIERKEMFTQLRSEMAETSFLFLGFSLSDPNFGLLHDDVRLVYGMNLPVSYTVQGRRDPIKRRYLTSMDINTIWLDSWNDMPGFLQRMNPHFVTT